MSDQLPFKFRPLKENPDIKTHFLGYQDGLIETVPEGWVLAPKYETHYADKTYNFKLRDDDVWIVTYPKSGTTWTQHLLWLLLNDLDYEETTPVDNRSPFIDFDQIRPIEKYRHEMEEMKKSVSPDDPLSHKIDTFAQTLRDNVSFDLAESLPTNRTRLIKSHLPFSLMPPELVKKNKVVYVARDPRDVMVSYYYHHCLIRHHEFIGDFKTFFDYFVKDKVLWSPFWDHIKQGWQLRKEPNVFFLFFDDLKQNLREVVNKLCAFLEVSYSEEQIESLLEQLKIENMRDNPAVNNTELMKELGIFKREGSFIRTGKSGGWRSLCDDEMVQRLEDWMKKNCKGTDLPMDRLWKK